MYSATIAHAKRAEFFRFLSASNSFCVRIVYLKAHDGKLLFWIANMAWPSERDSFMCVKCLINFFLSFFSPRSLLHCLLKKRTSTFIFLHSFSSILVFPMSAAAKKRKRRRRINKVGEKGTKIGKNARQSDTEWKIHKSRAQQQKRQQQQQSKLVVSSFARCSLKLMILLFQNLWTFIHSLKLRVNPFLLTFFHFPLPRVQ